jgi:hypothetical protein
MRLKIIVFIVLCFSFNGLNAQNDGAGNTGLSFLKIGVGARSISMGEAFSSYTDDASAIVYNPSRLLFGASNNVLLMHNMAAQDLTNDFIGAKVVFNKFALGFGIVKSGVDNIEIRLQPGPALDKFNSENLSINLSGAFKLNDFISVGLTTKFLYEKYYVDEASGFGFDFGTSYSKDNTNFSFVISNLGSMSALKNESTKLPASLRFGGSYIIPYRDFSFAIALDGFKVLDGGLFHIHSGGEASYKDFIFVRLGYQTNYENKGFSMGLGFKYKGINLDYAFTPYTSAFGTGNTFSLGVTF